jgi:hypothetical protein
MLASFWKTHERLLALHTTLNLSTAKRQAETFHSYAFLLRLYSVILCVFLLQVIDFSCFKFCQPRFDNAAAQISTLNFQ